MNTKVAPQIEIELPAGYTARPAALDDVDALASLFNRVSQQMIGADDFSANELRVDLSLPGVNLERDTCVMLAPDGSIAAYQDVFAILKPPVYPTVWGRVDPEHMGRGLGTALMNWGMQRAYHVLDKVPANARVALRAHTNASWQPSRDLLAAQGFEHIRNFHTMRVEMDGPPPAPQWPDGITVHVYQHPDESSAVYQAVEDSFRDHFGYIEQPFEEGFNLFQKSRFEDELFAPELWFLAKEGDQIAGISLNNRRSHEDENTGWLSTLGVLRPWRKRGLGLALLLHSFGAYWQRGIKAVELGVDASNLTGATRLYEKAGMFNKRSYELYEYLVREGEDLSTMRVED